MLPTIRGGWKGRPGQDRARGLPRLAAGEAFVPLLLLAVLCLELGIGVQDMTRDVAAIAHVHPLFGALSSLRILLW